MGGTYWVMPTENNALRVGYGTYVYEHVPGWGKLPDGWEWNHAVGIGIDALDRIFVYNRSAHPIIVLDTDGNVLDSWGAGQFRSAHHLEVGPDGSLYTTDLGSHTVQKWTAEGELLMTLGTPGKPAEKMSGNPFNMPTDVSVATDGTLYISDGYGNARIHHYTATGELIKSWGEPGDGPGQFLIPHSLCLDKTGNVYVADRENSRIQVFTADGQFVREWKGVHRPDHIWQGPDGNMYVAELGFRQGLTLDSSLYPEQPSPHEVSHPSGVKILTPIGQWLGGWGMSTDTPGDIIAGHAMAMDSKGDLYVGETLDGARVQKYARVG